MILSYIEIVFPTSYVLYYINNNTLHKIKLFIKIQGHVNDRSWIFLNTFFGLEPKFFFKKTKNGFKWFFFFFLIKQIHYLKVLIHVL